MSAHTCHLGRSGGLVKMNSISLQARNKSGRSALATLSEPSMSHSQDGGKNYLTLLRTLVKSKLFLFMMVLFLPISGWAQVDQGAITGTVADSTGAMLTGATVTL